MFKKIDDHFEEVILVFLMSSMSLLIIAQIFMRYVMNSSLTWSEELARYMFVWLTYIGVAYGVKKNSHVCVEAIVAIFPFKIKLLTYLIAQFLFLLFSCLMIYEGMVLSIKILSFGQLSPALGIPMGYVYLAPAFGFVVVFIRLFQNIFTESKRYISGGVQ